ncbi:hypothetical protein GWI33_013483 [Rhynchophorus ferrugineus]|uniref:Uncharacterized protein n=1 Tax=Rhynchophorus ferrugineus TaxID=354439 RepID=A0A834I3B1_RHYFE|nr:hypothetical protein GWI33_013483 [Rhynchophorus ferrugineus]
MAEREYNVNIVGDVRWGRWGVSEGNRDAVKTGAVVLKSLTDSETEDSPRRYGGSHTYQHPLYQQPAGLSDTPTSENASDATLTDSELALARDSTLLVHNGLLSEPFGTPPPHPARNTEPGLPLPPPSGPLRLPTTSSLPVACSY